MPGITFLYLGTSVLGGFTEDEGSLDAAQEEESNPAVDLAQAPGL